MSKWPMVKLGEVTTKIGSGSTPRGGDSVYKRKGIAFIRSLNVRLGYFSFNDLAYIDTDQAALLDNVTLSANDVLLNITGASVARVCVVPLDVLPARVNQHVAIIRCMSLIDSNYLSKFLLSASTQKLLLSIAESGATRQALTKQQIEALEIPRPPLPEQKRIVELLDRAQALIDRRKEQLALMASLAQSVFSEMFGDPVKNEKGWEKRPISNFGRIQTGNTPSRNESHNYGHFIEWIKSDNIVLYSPFVSYASEYLSESGAASGRIADTNSILVCCIAGSKESIGRAGLTNRKVAFNQQINAVTPNSNVNPWFLLFQFRVAQSLIQRAATDSMKGMVNKTKFSETLFLLPPLPLQQQFAERVRRIEAEKERMTASLKELENNFNALMQEAFE